MTPRLAVLTTGRQDWGILRPVCLALRESKAWTPIVMAGGLHLDPAFGDTVRAVEADVGAVERIEGTAGAGASQAAAMVAAIGPALERVGASAMLVVGDRSETAAAALGATLARVPIVHLHGGEETEGAIDNALRHAITKLAHLHLVSHEDHARRVRQLGEPDAEVIVVGAPGLDNLHRADLPDRAALEHFLGIALVSPIVLVTHHPTTLGGDPAIEARAFIDALERVDATYVITLPNNDAGNEVMRAAQKAFAAAAPSRRVAVEALGEARYFGMLRCADAMAGNSSSGIIEAPIVRLPVVDVGDRQRGRLRAENVINAAIDSTAISAALARALDPAFRASLRGTGPYGDGHSGARVRAALDAWTPPSPPRKRFVERGS